MKSRYVQATHQMAESGDYVDIRFQDASRYKKPVGIYWLQSAALKLTGYNNDAPVWVYRLVSVAGATRSRCSARLLWEHSFLAKAPA